MRDLAWAFFPPKAHGDVLTDCLFMEAHFDNELWDVALRRADRIKAAVRAGIDAAKSGN